MIHPTRLTISLSLLSIIPALGTIFIGDYFWTLWYGACIFLALALILDIFLILSPNKLLYDLDIPKTLYVGAADPFKAQISAQQTFYHPVFEGLLITAEENKNDLQPITSTYIKIGKEGSGVMETILTPIKRGNLKLQSLYLRWSSPLGLVQKIHRIDISAEIPIISNIRAVHQKAIQISGSSSDRVGIKRQSFLSQGSEFDQLRKYMPGLDHRAIDWKASARHYQLLVRDFRAERNHQIYLIFDTGYLMSESIQSVSRLDHAINSALMLSYVSLKEGDLIGSFSFSDSIQHFRPAKSGIQSLAQIQKDLSSIQYGAEETNFTLGLHFLLSKLRRRSLLIIFTEFIDTITAHLMLENLQYLAKRHLILFVSFQNTDLYEISDEAPSSLEKLHQAVLAAEFLREKEAVFKTLSRMGIQHIETSTDQLTTKLLSKYLDIKQREQI